METPRVVAKIKKPRGELKYDLGVVSVNGRSVALKS
jgi:hypothetical protein